MMNQLQEQVKDLAVVEAPPKLEGKKLIMVLAPSPNAPKKPASKPQAPKSTGAKDDAGDDGEDSEG